MLLVASAEAACDPLPRPEDYTSLQASQSRRLDFSRTMFSSTAQLLRHSEPPSTRRGQYRFAATLLLLSHERTNDRTSERASEYSNDTIRTLSTFFPRSATLRLHCRSVAIHVALFSRYPECHSRSFPSSSRYAFVEFRETRDAEAAYHEM